MRLKAITILSVIVNLGLLGYIFYNSAKAREIINPDSTKMTSVEDISDNFDAEFYDRVSSQNIEMQNLLLLSDSKNLSAATKMTIEKYQPYSDDLKLRSKNCVALKDKRSFKIELGKLSVKVQDGQPTDVEGLKISRANADILLAQIFVYDKAIVNICLQLEKVQPNTADDRKFILALLDEQQKIVSSYEKFKLQITQSQTEDDVVKAVTDNKPKVDSLDKQADVDTSNANKTP
jgi:hypothetical protein